MTVDLIIVYYKLILLLYKFNKYVYDSMKQLHE